MKIYYSKNAQKTISLLDKSIKNRIKIAIENLLIVPPKGDIKQLKGAKDTYRVRVGKYRIIYNYKGENILYISDIGSRGDIYK